MKVTAHLCSVGYREAVALGIDNVEHGLFANSEYAPNKRPDECPSGFRSGYADLDVGGPEVQATFRDMIVNGATNAELRSLARSEGMITLRESGLVKIWQGITSVDEVLKETTL